MQMIDKDTLNFALTQATHIERTVYRKKYGSIQYPELVPVDTSAPEWIQSVTFFSMDSTGQAEWLSGNGDDIPFVDLSKDSHQSSVHMASVGYQYGLEEVNQAQRLGISLSADKGITARRAYEEFVDTTLLTGSGAKGMNGLINYPGISTVVAPNGAGGTPTWFSKTTDEIMLDINNLLSGVWLDSLNTEICDTLLIPEQLFVALAGKIIPNTSKTLMSHIMENNVLKMRYGRDLTIRTVRGLQTAGGGGTARIVAYRRDPEVLKAHIPMPFRFLPMQQVNLQFKVPGIFRLGGLDIRLPAAVRYLDGV